MGPEEWGQACAIAAFFAKFGFTVKIPPMARKPRIEIEGGLYHVIFRGNDRQAIFHSDEDHTKFLSLLTAAKERLPFLLGNGWNPNL